jgi:cytokinin riboside 5'-monophosphate phosphoribohydrolase
MINNVCVFCSSSDMVSKIFFDEAESLAEKLVENNFNVVYGGAKVGLMGAIARKTKELGGKVIGILPENLKKIEIAFEQADELIITKNMQERKFLLEQKSDAFIALPGGFGTLDEIFEMLTLKQLNLHSKPLILINTKNYYKNLIDMFEIMYEEKFAKNEYRKYYYIASDAADAVVFLKNYKPDFIDIATKW